MLGLGGFAATAFGIAPMMPDASDLPKRLVTETVTPQDMQSQLDALAEHELQLYRTDLTRSSDTADSLLKRMTDASIAEFVGNTVAAENGATERLAQAFEALVPEAERKSDLLHFAEEVVRRAMPADGAFEALWQGAREMLLSYTDTTYVSAAYARELSSAAGDNETLGAISVGTPHFSIKEFEQLVTFLDGRRAVIGCVGRTGRYNRRDRERAKESPH